MDENQTIQNQPDISKEERKRAKEVEIERRVRTRKMKKMGTWAGVVILLAALAYGGWYGVSQYGEATALGPDFSKEYAYPPDQDEFSRQHIPEGTKSSVPYLSNPPTVGPHWPDPVRDAVYDRSQPDEGLIHSLEHGRIWISYRSSIPQEAKNTLRRIALDESMVILTVRDENPADIALAAWEHLDTFDLNEDGSFDEKRIRDFIRRYRDKGPEKVPFMTGKAYE